MNPLARLGLRARVGFGRVVPDPFVIAVGLTVSTLVAALIGGMSPVTLLEIWHDPDGLWSLLAFAMQIGLMLVLGFALAAAPVVRDALRRIAGAASGARQLVGMTALLAIGLALLNWSLGLIGGALLAREAGAVARRRRWRLHYPLLCAAGYSGLMVWHGGLSGSAPLKATTAADMADVLGSELAQAAGTVPLGESLLGPMNLLVSGGLLVIGPVLFMVLTPGDGADPAPTSAPEGQLDVLEPSDDGEAESPVAKLERSALVTWALVIPMAAALGVYLVRRGVGRLDLNTVNLALWCLAMIAHGRPHRFVAACTEGIRTCSGVALQFPLYAGIMAIMAASGLSTMLSERLVEVGEGALLPVTFLSAGTLNLFVPSGGGQWAVQGPILVDAALRLGVPVGDVVMAMAYGDQWTNMIQPFWALPLLAITGVRARDIVGYCVIWMAAGGLWMGAVLSL